jgi:hypothetical protein
LQREGIKVIDGQQLMQNARMIKTQDEITLLSTSCVMVERRLRGAVSGHEAGHSRE